MARVEMNTMNRAARVKKAILSWMASLSQKAEYYIVEAAPGAGDKRCQVSWLGGTAS